MAAYPTIEWPGLEYASSTHPYLSRDVQTLEGLQRHAERFMINNPNSRLSPKTDHAKVSPLIQRIGWQSLQGWQNNAHCILLFRIIHGLIAVLENPRTLMPTTSSQGPVVTGTAYPLQRKPHPPYCILQLHTQEQLVIIHFRSHPITMTRSHMQGDLITAPGSVESHRLFYICGIP